MRPMSQYRQPQEKRGRTRRFRKFKLTLSVAVVLIGVSEGLSTHVGAATSVIRSGATGYCLDDYRNNTVATAEVDIWSCNNSLAQNWIFTGIFIKHDGGRCLSVDGDSKTEGARVTLNRCTAAAGQVWLMTNKGFENPNSNLCLAATATASGAHTVLASCKDMPQPLKTWTPTNSSGQSLVTPSCSSAKGERIACYAEREWAAWSAKNSDHAGLLNTYTDGNSYEEWCADFVSYVYSEAGYPFTQGERNGWDEYDANSVQNMGFTMHPADGSYTPKTGDVAYFNYNGGHVEIVVSGGKTPTFVYGDSGNPDPVTGNGDMAANTITNDGDAGQVMYYLSPD